LDRLLVRKLPISATPKEGLGVFKDEVNPTEDELRLWAYSERIEPTEDFDLIVMDSFSPSLLAQFVRDETCPTRSFFLGCLYHLVGDAFRPVDRRWGDREGRRARAMSIISGMSPSDDPLLAKWLEDATRLISGQTEWSDEWCTFGLSHRRVVEILGADD
jgi:hypothetical protein